MSLRQGDDGCPVPSAQSQSTSLNVEGQGDRPESRPTSTTSQAQVESEAALEATPTAGGDGGDEDGEEQVKAKRSRGRPRLNTRDETAADRRRTQIRLAQRAYRHRKDTAITELELKLQRIEQVHRSIHANFSRFYNIMLSEGILEQAPHAAFRLKPIAEELIRLSGPTSESNDNPTAESGETAGQDPGPATGPRGLGAGRTKNALSPRLPMAGGHQRPAPAQYEVVTEPTSQNATFPFTFPTANLEMPPIPGPHPHHHPHIGTDVAHMPPFPRLPSPQSYAFQERTFGRRLHRSVCEFGLKLATMPNPPPARFAAVFGFTLLFEERESIIMRLLAALKRSHNEELIFWNLSHKPLSLSELDSLEEQFRAPEGSVPKPGVLGSTIVRPFGPASLDDERDLRIQTIVRNFESDILLPSEVEQLLNRMGIFIPPLADFVQAEIDINSLRDDLELTPASSRSQPLYSQYHGEGPATSLGTGVLSTTATRAAGATAQGSRATTASGAAGGGGSSQGGREGGRGRLFPPVSGSPTPSTWANNVSGYGPFSSRTSNFESSNAIVTSSDPTINIDHVFGPPSMLNPGVPSPMAHDYNNVWQFSSSWNKIKVTVDIPRLILEIAKKSICLGRSPGVRRKDLLYALSISMGLSGSLDP